MLILCLNSFFSIPQFDPQLRITQQQFMYSFPGFLSLNLGRDIWNLGQFEKDCRCIAFPLFPDIPKNALNRDAPCQYQLVAVISHLSDS
jgi:hypothetical protein